MAFVYPMKHKSEAVDATRWVVATANKHNHQITTFRSDNAKEYFGSNMNRYLLDCSVDHEPTSAYCPEQNGRVERQNRTIVEMMRTLLCAANLPKSLWAEMARTATYIRNMIPLNRLNFHTPFEVRVGCAPDVAHLRIIGSRAFVYTPDVHRLKLDEKCVEGILVGYDFDRYTYRVWVPGTKTVHSSPNVQIIESLLHQPSFTDSSSHDDRPAADKNLQITESSDESTDRPPDCVANRTRSKSTAKPTHSEQSSINLLLTSIEEETMSVPQTYQDAVQSEQSRQWSAAMQEELISHKKNGTWSLVDRSMCCRTLLKTRWIYKTKIDQHGNLERFKARLVVKGCSQRVGVNYTETFAPVARFETIRLFLAVTAQKKFGLCQFDIKTAFLNGRIDEEIYMSQPEGFDDGSGRVCRLHKSLYGLKQAPRAWNTVFDDFLQKFGLTRSKNDPCLYTSDDLLVVLYVDDGLIAARTADAGDKLVTAMSSAFEATTSSANYYLGIQIKRSADRQLIKIHQSSYIKGLLKKFGMTDCHPIFTPAEGNVTLRPNQEQSVDVSFRQLIGGLMFLTVFTRPDIAFAVHRLSQYLDNLSTDHWQAAKRVLRYLKGTQDVGINFDGNALCPNQLLLYTDSDFATCVTTRKSISGVVITVNGGPVSWTSRKQGSVASSTTDAEYIAAHEGARELVWTRRIIADLGAPKEHRRQVPLHT